MTKSIKKEYSQHDEIEAMRLELLCAVNVGEAEDITGRLDGQVLHEGFFAHCLQPFQLILKTKSIKRRSLSELMKKDALVAARA